MFFKDISYLELWSRAICATLIEVIIRNILRNFLATALPGLLFVKRHYEEHFCGIIINFDQWFTRCCLKYFYLHLWRPFVRRSGTIPAILVEHSFEIRRRCHLKKKFTDRRRLITIAHLESLAQVSYRSMGHFVCKKV